MHSGPEGTAPSSSVYLGRALIAVAVSLCCAVGSASQRFTASQARRSSLPLVSSPILMMPVETGTPPSATHKEALDAGLSTCPLTEVHC